MADQKPSEKADQPPSPGGAPDQGPNDVPPPPADRGNDDTKGKKSGYGHIGNKQVPRPKGAPPPHEIF